MADRIIEIDPGPAMIATEKIGRMHYVLAHLEPEHRTALLAEIRQIVRDETTTTARLLDRMDANATIQGEGYEALITRDGIVIGRVKL